jgi:hypothetical protein
MNISSPGLKASDLTPTFWSYDDPAFGAGATYVIPEGVKLMAIHASIIDIKPEIKIDAANWRFIQLLDVTEYASVVNKLVHMPGIPVSDGVSVRVRNLTAGAGDMQLIGEEYP